MATYQSYKDIAGDLSKCGREGCGNADNLKYCNGCKTLKYCSAECQKAEWKSHKNFCKSLGSMTKEMKSSAKHGVPVCVLCDHLQTECQCEGLKQGEAVAFSKSNRPLTEEERVSNFNKYINILRKSGTPFSYKQFNKDFKDEVSTVMRIETIFRLGADWYSKEGGETQKIANTLKFPYNDVIVLINVAASKFVDCAFAEMGTLEIILCGNVYVAMDKSIFPKQAQRDLAKAFKIIEALRIAAENTPGWSFL